MTYGLPKLSNLQVSSDASFISVDVTDWVKAWITGTLPNQGSSSKPAPPALASTFILTVKSRL
jgi:hypothetical protein